MKAPGVHLVVDGVTQMAFDKEYLEAYLRALVALVGMTRICGPLVTTDGRGWRGFCIIAESHTAVYVQRDQVWAELFSCKFFDTGIAIPFMVNRLKLSQHVHQRVERRMPDVGQAG